MSIENLGARLKELALLEDGDAPMLSCYLNLEDGPDPARWLLRRRVEVLLAERPLAERVLLVEAFRRAEVALEEVPSGHAAVACFLRGGSRPVQKILPLPAPVEERVAWQQFPLLGPLVELKKDYRRYVVVLTTPRLARIHEVVLGPATAELWATHPALRERVEPEWSVQRYLRHRDRPLDDHLQEKIAVLEDLFRRGGDGALVLAGDPGRVTRLRAALPKELRRRLVPESLVLSERSQPLSGDAGEAAVRQTLEAFLRRLHGGEESMADTLRHELDADGLAVAGPRATLDALYSGTADTLFLAPDWKRDGSLCPECGALDARAGLLACPVCLDGRPRRIDLREHLVRLAAQSGCPVEALEGDQEMLGLGAAALLRVKGGLLGSPGKPFAGRGALLAGRRFLTRRFRESAPQGPPSDLYASLAGPGAAGN